MSVIHEPRRPRPGPRNAIFLVVIFGCLIVIFLRLWFIQIARSQRMNERAEVYGKSFTAIRAPRGLIYDRNLKLIAGVESELVLTAQPSIVLKNTWVLDRVSQMLADAGAKSADSVRLLRKVRDAAFRPSSPAPIFAGVPVEVAAKITESPEALPGIGLENQAARYYPDPISFSHLLGYVWTPGPEDFKRAEKDGRKTPAVVGKGGIEWVYERDLEGIDGYEATLVDRHRRAVRVAQDNPPTPGSQLVLGIDANLQAAAIQALGARRGAVVAIEPTTGEVICMASTPTFDLTLFRNGISQEDFDALNGDANHPFLNRAVATAVSPGSTFKIVTTVAAMRSGAFDPARTVFCAGGYRLGRQLFKCLGHHGAIQYEQAFEQSCNTYFSDLSMLVGKDELRQTALDMGFFAKTGIDLPYERSGLIPTDDWLERAHRRWVPGYTVLTGIGQGDVLTTPLQMADLAAIVANSGVAYKPHLVHGVRHGEGQPIDPVTPSVLCQVRLPASDWDTIREAMVGVMEHGTGQGCKIPGLTWAGKTGSAEVRGQNKTNSWFIGFAPADHPRIAICVMVEDAGHGAEVAGPVARTVVERFFEQR